MGQFKADYRNSCSHSLEILPCLKDAQSTFPAPTIQSSPIQVQNSASVMPGGNLRTIKRRFGAGDLCGPFESGRPDCAFFVILALTGRTPLRPFADWDISLHLTGHYESQEER